MKIKKMYIILAILLLAVTIWLINRYFNSEAYFLSKLPEKYKNYSALNEPIKSSKHQIRPLFTGARAKSIYRDSINNVLIIQKMEEFEGGKDKNSILSCTYYRINSDGKVLDSLTENTDQTYFGNEFNGHLLYESSYSNYLKTGSEEKFPYQQVNQDLKMAKKELTTLLTDLRMKADAVNVDYNNQLKIYTIAMGDKVQRVYSAESMQIDIDYKFQNNFHLLSPITSYADGKAYDWKLQKAPIHIDYFLKQTYAGASSPSFMAPAPVNRPANWLGIAYLTIALPNDSLQLKHPLYFFPQADGFPESYDNYSWGRLDYFSSPHFKFKLLTVGYDNDHVHSLDGCYILTPIAK